MGDVVLQTCQTRKLFNQVNNTEYVFSWTIVHSSGFIECFKDFVTKKDSYTYEWTIGYKQNIGISLWLKSCRHAGANNILVLGKLGIKPPAYCTNSKYYCVFPYDDTTIDVLHPGKKLVGEISDLCANENLIFPVAFIVKIKIIWEDLSHLEFQASHTSKLSTDFEKLCMEKHSTDVSFVFTNNKVIQAHKLILMARSPVFQAMFQSGMKESKENRVVVKDIDPEIFENLIRYIYTGRMEVTPADKLTDVLVGADKYGLIEYRDYCARELIKLMSVKNAADNLIVSNLLNLDSLKKEAIKFILSKKQEVVKTDGYKNLRKNHLHLVADLFEKS